MEFLLFEPENTAMDLRAASGEKKAATVTLHCDMSASKRQPSATIAKKNAAFRSEGGTNFAS
jgi:hypothetical protein